MLSSTTSGLGFKSIAGSTGWGSYVLEGDVRMYQIGPNGNAGLVFRLHDRDLRQAVDDPNPAPTIAPYADPACHGFGQVGVRPFDATRSQV